MITNSPVCTDDYPPPIELRMSHYSISCILLKWTPALPSGRLDTLLKCYRVYVNGEVEGMVCVYVCVCEYMCRLCVYVSECYLMLVWVCVCVYTTWKYVCVCACASFLCECVWTHST